MQTVRLGFRPENKWTGFITRDAKSATVTPEIRGCVLMFLFLVQPFSA